MQFLPFLLDSLKSIQGVSNSVKANQNTSPPSLLHLLDLPNLLNLSHLLTQSGTNPLSFEQKSNEKRKGGSNTQGFKEGEV